MEYEFDYERATIEQLTQQYNWCNNRLVEMKREIMHKKILNKIFIVYVMLILIFEYLIFFSIFKNITFAGIVSLGFLFLHCYYSDNCFKNLEAELKEANDYILELTSEIEYIKELIYKRYKEGQVK